MYGRSFTAKNPTTSKMSKIVNKRVRDIPRMVPAAAAGIIAWTASVARLTGLFLGWTISVTALSLGALSLNDMLGDRSLTIVFCGSMYFARLF